MDNNHNMENPLPIIIIIMVIRYIYSVDASHLPFILTAEKQWFNKGFTHRWDHTMGFLNIRGMGLCVYIIIYIYIGAHYGGIIMVV
jgi:hypothetical protein